MPTYGTLPLTSLAPGDTFTGVLARFLLGYMEDSGLPVSVSSVLRGDFSDSSCFTYDFTPSLRI
jgi:hypothetical protein